MDAKQEKQMRITNSYAAVLLLIACTIAAILSSGCRSYTSARWPVDTFVDPVTEEVPHVIVD